MRKWCCAPSHLPGRRVSMAPADVAVRAYRLLPVRVEKIAQGAARRSVPKPACSYESPLKVASNSTELPGPARALPPARAPSSVSVPEAAVAEPAAASIVDVQPDG